MINRQSNAAGGADWPPEDQFEYDGNRFYLYHHQGGTPSPTFTKGEPGTELHIFFATEQVRIPSITETLP
jgi:hypothetical protein